MTRSRGRVCFYSPYLYPVATGGEIEFVGGTEVRQWALARGLAERGFEVVVATCDYGQGAVLVRDGVTLLRTYSTREGFPGIRLFYPRLWKAMRTLRRAGADVYIANGAGIPAGWAYDAARSARARFVFMASSDTDAMNSLPFLANRRERWWYLRGLRGADARVAQTELQRQLFRDNFSVETEVIANPVELPANPVDAGANSLVLWLSTYKPSKRPEWFSELAQRLPQYRFVMAGFSGSDAGGDSWFAAQRASALSSNLEVNGFVEHGRIGEFLSKTALFVHTSPVEGFPMTLLEAWAYGIPSVSAVDPGGTIGRNRIGEVVSSFDELVETVGGLMRDPDRRRVAGNQAREYVSDYHGLDRMYEPLGALLDRVISAVPREISARRR